MQVLGLASALRLLATGLASIHVERFKPRATDLLFADAPESWLSTTETLADCCFPCIWCAGGGGDAALLIACKALVRWAARGRPELVCEGALRDALRGRQGR